VTDAGHFSLVTFRVRGLDRDQAGAVRADGTVVRVPELVEFPGLIFALERWQELEPALRRFDPFSAEPVVGVRIVAPLRFPRKLLCAGANYGSHMKEMGIELDGQRPAPYFFLKPPTTTIIGTGDDIVIPADPAARVDWEAELAIVVGRRARGLTVAESRGVVAGYTIVNDVSARGLHHRADAVGAPFMWDWLASKGMDSFCPMGPGITPYWHIPDPQDLDIRLLVNGTVEQQANTADMLAGVDELVAAASTWVTLEPGDVISTGTPAGVGMPRGRFLKGGDEVSIEITGLGRLHNRVRAASD
jgi:2-keto-4-pentenoate hydratase/2-oxohepta-3-ene-1,7-dioic acid hydratase in catechol pathway